MDATDHSQTLSDTTTPNSPRDLWRTLRTIDFALLDHIAYLSRLTARKSKSRAHYCTPGRQWLAERLGVSVWTISRHTSALRDRGILAKVQRRPVAGKWQTNLYSLVGRGTWIIARSLRGLHRPPNRVASNAHLVPSKREDDGRRAQRSALRAIISDLEKKLRGG